MLRKRVVEMVAEEGGFVCNKNSSFLALGRVTIERRLPCLTDGGGIMRRTVR